MMSNGNSAEASTSPSPAPSSIGNNAPKFGTLVPNRVFVGGISGNTTEQDLLELFTKYGKVKATKVISDRAGVSKGYGFVTFETEEEARKLTQEADNIMLKDRKLNIAPAIKKQVSDLGYIKPYSPRLVDGSAAATVLGTNGTVFFGGNGTTYAYTNPVPMLANPSEFHQAVAGVPTPTATHPTFPPQVPQTGAHNAAVTAATQVGGTPAAGYPAQFVYPQTMYIPQQYHQFQTAALQPQWTTSPQWRWVSPSAYAQPGPGYITSDGLYTQAAATYVPGSSFLGSESTSSSSSSSSSSDHSCSKGTPAAATPPPTPSPVPSSFPYHHNAFPYHNYIPIADASPPVMHSYNPLFSYSMANSSVSSLQSHVSCATSVTTMTTTTTTAVIGATGSSVISKDRKRPVSEAFETGILEFKRSLSKGQNNCDTEQIGIELESTKNYSASDRLKSNGSENCPLHQTVFSTPVQKKKSPTLCKDGRNQNGSGSTNGSSSSSSSSSSEEFAGKLASHSVKSEHLNGNIVERKYSTDQDYPNPDFSTLSSGNNRQTLGWTAPSPLCSHSPNSSLDGENTKNMTLPVGGMTSWCPQHNPRSMPIHLWTQRSKSNVKCSCVQNCRSPNRNGVTSIHKICRHEPASSERLYSSSSDPSVPRQNSTLLEPKKILGPREEALIGKPFLKVSGTWSAKAGVLPQNPIMMVPWYQYGPSVNPSWFPYPPLVTLYPAHFSYPPSCYSPNSSTSVMSATGLPSHLPTSSVPQQPFSSASQTQPCKLSPPLPANISKEKGCSSGKQSLTWWLPDSGNTTPSVIENDDSCAVPISRGHHTNSEVVGLSSFNPLLRGTHPYTGEPVRFLQRFTQLPDDRCALLPISPPLTPHQIEFDPRHNINLNILPQD